jgi:hypothetical protein
MVAPTPAAYAILVMITPAMMTTPLPIVVAAITRFAVLPLIVAAITVPTLRICRVIGS